MEFFLPSILFLLVACGIVFFVIPRFGPLILASVALILLILGVYNHYSLFQSEYKMSTWQMGAVANAPYILIGALVLGIVLYLLYLVPSGANSNTNASAKLSLPPANTATNAVTEGINNAMRSTANLFKMKVNGENGSKGTGNEGSYNNNNANTNNNNSNNLNFRGPNRGPNNRGRNL